MNGEVPQELTQDEVKFKLWIIQTLTEIRIHQEVDRMDSQKFKDDIEPRVREVEKNTWKVSAGGVAVMLLVQLLYMAKSLWAK